MSTQTSTDTVESVPTPSATAVGPTPSASVGEPALGGAGGMGGAPSNAGAGMGGNIGTETGGAASDAGSGGLAGAESSGGLGGGPGAGGLAGSNSMGGADSNAGGAGGAASPTAEFDLFRFECPCLPGTNTGDGNCDVSPETDRQTVIKEMGGDPNTIYDVTFRVRGLTEPNTYVGGTLEGERLYVGGTTSTAGYTSYMMTIAEPPEHYFFNYSPTTGHVHFPLDYEVTVKIRGGSQVTFEVDGDGSIPDGHQVANFDQMVIPDVPPAPEWYDGQFVQLDVVSVEVAP